MSCSSLWGQTHVTLSRDKSLLFIQSCNRFFSPNVCPFPPFSLSLADPSVGRCPGAREGPWGVYLGTEGGRPAVTVWGTWWRGALKPAGGRRCKAACSQETSRTASESSPLETSVCVCVRCLRKLKMPFVWVCTLLRFQAALLSNNSRIRPTDSHTLRRS